MSQVVTIPGVGDIEFPDGMSQADMAAAIQRNFPQIHQQQPAADISTLPAGKPGPTSRVNLTPTQIQALPPQIRDARAQRIYQDFAAQDSRDSVGALEGMANAASNIPATMAGGLNMSASLLGGRGAEDSLRRFNQTREGLTYQPRTPQGQESAAALGDALAAPSRAVGYGANQLFEATGSQYPMLGAGAETLGNAALMFNPAKALGKTGSALLERAPKPALPDVPTTEQLRTASNALYKAADDSGVVIRPESTAKAAAMIQQVADAENLGKLTPKLKEAHDVLVERAAAGKPMSLKDADKARGLINDAAQSMDAGDRRLAAIVKSGYDGYLNSLSPADTLTGDPATGVAFLKQARQLWTRKSHSETLDAMQRNAEIDGEAKYTQAGTEHALRNEFKKLYKSEDAQRFMTPEQLAAVRKVAAPGAAANALRNLGKMDPTRGGMATALNNIVGGGLGAAAGGLVGGLPGAAAGGLIGKTALGTSASLANMAALRGTVGRVAGAREALIGRGLPQAPSQAMPMAQPLTGELMPRKPLALSAPTIISGPRSAPGSMYARQQMGMTPDVELAGMQHPGMARQSIPRRPAALPYLPEQQSPNVVVDAQGRAAASSSQIDNYLRDQRQTQAAALHPGTARESTPPTPLALPYLPQKVSPFVVDSSGRAATSPEQLASYMKDSGLGEVKAKGKSAKSVFDQIEATQEPTRAISPGRSPTQIKLELQRLLVQMRAVPAGADALYVQGLRRRLDQLQAELKQRLSQESSGAATSQRPTK